MAAQGDATDLMMKFVIDNDLIPAESRTEYDYKSFHDNRMYQGFEEGYIFEVDSFGFGVKLDGSDKSEDGKGKGDGYNHDALMKSLGGGKKGKGGHNLSKDELAKLLAGAKNKSSGFKEWRRGEGGRYPAQVADIKYTRGIDRATSLLFKYMMECRTFDSVTLLKRRGAGGVSAGEPYLRFDFHGVLLTDLEWSNEEPIKEEGTLIARIVTIHYRPQLPDGTLGAPISRFFSNLKNVTQPITL